MIDCLCWHFIFCPMSVLVSHFGDIFCGPSSQEETGENSCSGALPAWVATAWRPMDIEYQPTGLLPLPPWVPSPLQETQLGLARPAQGEMAVPSGCLEGWQTSGCESDPERGRVGQSWTIEFNLLVTCWEISYPCLSRILVSNLPF